MRLLLAHGADPKIATTINVTALQVAAGIGWVEGITYEWSEQANVEAVKLLLDLGIDPNAQAETGRTALHGAGHKGRTAVIQLLVDAGAKLDTRDYGMTGNDAGGRLIDHTWQAGGLCGRSGQGWHAIGDRPPRGRAAPSQADDGARPGSAADGSHAGVGLHHGDLRRRRPDRISSKDVGRLSRRRNDIMSSSMRHASSEAVPRRCCSPWDRCHLGAAGATWPTR